MHKVALVFLFAALLPCFQVSARASAVLVLNGNFTDSSVTNGQAIQIYGASANTVSDWSVCTSATCPSGTVGTTPTPANGTSALAFLYTYQSQGVTVSDTIGTSHHTFALADSGAIPNTYPGACTTVTTGCGNYLAIDGSTSYNMAIYQTVTNLTVGANYLLTFYTAAAQQANTGGATTEDWEVYFGSSTPKTTTVISNPSGSFTPWSAVAMTFQATSASEVLEFLAQGGPSGDPPMDLLANVVLTQTPEPAGLALIGAGMLSLLALRKRWLKRA